MDVIEYAMKMEQDGMAFYKRHADATSDPDLKQIFMTLVDEEARHYQIFKRLKENPSEISGDISFSAPENVKTVKNLFEQMSQSTETKQFGEGAVTVWTEALRIEEKAHAFYKEKAEVETDVATKKLLLMIAEEETRHVHMIDAVLMYLKHPEAFAQSAQYKNFQSLEGH
jgi:rubrerythrin